MKMQKFVFVFAIVLFFVMSILQVQALLRPNVIVSHFEIKEGNAEVGKDFTLALTLTNLEPLTCAKVITTTVQVGYPFIQNGISRRASEDLCTNDESVVEFPMKIDPTATGGFYQIKVITNYETSTLAQFSSSDTLNILVAGTPEIKASIANSNPIDVYPGDTATITVNIENDGSFKAQSVSATMTSTDAVEIKWAKSMTSIGMLESKQSKFADFVVELPKNAPARDYPLNFEVSYLDENLDKQTKYFIFTLHTSKKAMFETSEAGSDILFSNMNSKKIQLLLKNTGTDTAYKITAKVLPQFPFSSDGSVRYIETITPGNSSEITFTLDTDKDATVGTYALDLLLNFEDAQGKKMQDTAKITLTIKEKDRFTKYFIDYWIAWLLIFVVIILSLIRKIFKIKKNS